MPGDESREPELASNCSDCGAPIDPDGSRSYAFGEQGLLCWSCAVRRGGRYDADSETWSRAPSVSGLSEASGEEE